MSCTMSICIVFSSMRSVTVLFLQKLNHLQQKFIFFFKIKSVYHFQLTMLCYGGHVEFFSLTVLPIGNQMISDGLWFCIIGVPNIQ